MPSRCAGSLSLGSESLPYHQVLSCASRGCASRAHELGRRMFEEGLLARIHATPLSHTHTLYSTSSLSPTSCRTKSWTRPSTSWRTVWTVDERSRIAIPRRRCSWGSKCTLRGCLQRSGKPGCGSCAVSARTWCARRTLKISTCSFTFARTVSRMRAPPPPRRGGACWVRSG